jgi:acyl-CoA synthetase (AMP-forming)/AMP-acid ligase II
VEAVLSTHPDIAAVAVAPRADAVMGEIGVAVVVPREGRAPSLEALREFAAARLARHKLPEALEFTAALPLTAGEKVDRGALSALVAGPSHRTGRVPPA